MPRTTESLARANDADGDESAAGTLTERRTRLQRRFLAQRATLVSSLAALRDGVAALNGHDKRTTALRDEAESAEMNASPDDEGAVLTIALRSTRTALVRKQHLIAQEKVETKLYDAANKAFVDYLMLGSELFLAAVNEARERIGNELRPLFGDDGTAESVAGQTLEMRRLRNAHVGWDMFWRSSNPCTQVHNPFYKKVPINGDWDDVETVRRTDLDRSTADVCSDLFDAADGQLGVADAFFPPEPARDSARRAR